jgi:hypothetical protein
MLRIPVAKCVCRPYFCPRLRETQTRRTIALATAVSHRLQQYEPRRSYEIRLAYSTYAYHEWHPKLAIPFFSNWNSQSWPFALKQQSCLMNVLAGEI